MKRSFSSRGFYSPSPYSSPSVDYGFAGRPAGLVRYPASSARSRASSPSRVAVPPLRPVVHAPDDADTICCPKCGCEFDVAFADSEDDVPQSDGVQTDSEEGQIPPPPVLVRTDSFVPSVSPDLS